MAETKWHPGTLLDLSGYYWRTATLHAAVKLDVFTVIGDQQLNVEHIASRINADDQALTRLLDALAALELVYKEGALYSNTAAAMKFLSKSSPEYIGYMILHHHYLVDKWRRLDESVLTGRPVREWPSSDETTHKDDSEREAFLMGMFNTASLTAPDLVKHVDLGSCRRLLDMGGGPGTYAIHFCMQYPNLTATVFDLPATRPFAEKTIERFNMTGRINFEQGSYLDPKQVLPGTPDTYDAIWMSHILHGEGYDACLHMVGKAYAAMAAGGMIIIHDFILEDTRTRPMFPAIFSLNMLLVTEEGRSYTESELSDMLKATGFRKITRLSYSGPSQSGILTAIK
jgi:hypothetical protein